MEPERLASLMGQMSLSDEEHPVIRNAQIPIPPQSTAGWRMPPRYHHGMSAEETAQYLKSYRDWFEEDRKIPPVPAPYVDRARLIAEQVHRRSDLEISKQGIPILRTMVGFPKHSSTTPTARLQPIRFEEMFLRRTHLGHYLLCRIVAPCSRMVAIQTVVEDTDGVAHDLSIYNFPGSFEYSLTHLDSLFPLGGVLAIREPTLKPPLQGNRPLLRVDSPTDITFVNSAGPLLHDVIWATGPTVPESPDTPATFDAWQQRGNAHFKASEWFLAAFAYCHGLALDPDSAVLRLNRAEAYLRLHYYSGALFDAQRVLSTSGISDAHVGKAVFRLAKAQYNRKEYDAAERSFVRWKNTYAGDTTAHGTADTWIDRCRARRKEQTTGEYDWVYMFVTAKRKIRVDVADYMGPIKVSQMEERGGGRGVLATKDIQTGDLLMVAKPFVSVYASDLPPDKIIMTLDVMTYTSKERTDAVLLARLIEKIYGNPDWHDQVYDLYAGPDYPSPPVAYPPTPKTAPPVELLEPTVDIDIARLEAICTYNNFCPFRLDDDQRLDKQASPTGLYPLASLFNHSCGANAIWYCIGDVMIVRAAEFIPAGAEITIPYSVEESYIDRQAALKKHMLEHCTCWLCEEDRKDGQERLQRRHKLKERVASGSAKLMSLALTEVRAYEREVRETFAPTRGPVRPLNALALHVVAEKLRESRDPKLLREALQKDLKALQYLGFEIREEGAQDTTGLPIATSRFPSVTTFLEPAAMMLRIAVTYLNLGNAVNATPWIKAALWLTNASVGGGKPLFMLIHERILNQMNLYQYAAEVL